MDLEFSVVFDKTQFAKLQIIERTIIGRNGVVCCLRMTALRPVIVVRSSLQKPATSQDATVRASIAQRLLVLFWHRVERLQQQPRSSSSGGIAGHPGHQATHQNGWA